MTNVRGQVTGPGNVTVHTRPSRWSVDPDARPSVTVRTAVKVARIKSFSRHALNTVRRINSKHGPIWLHLSGLICFVVAAAHLNVSLAWFIGGVACWLMEFRIGETD